MVTPVDFFPTLCGLLGLPIPRTVEGLDLSAAWLGRPDARTREATLTMNFGSHTDYIWNGQEWRGVMTGSHHYVEWLAGPRQLFDLRQDPLEQHNLHDDPAQSTIVARHREMLRRLQAERGDRLQPCEAYHAWCDPQRRIIRNSFGPLPDPEGEPEWSLLRSDA
jgi:arylsulfatase A-like enzyme